MDLEVIFYHLTNNDRGFTALFMKKKKFPLKNHYREYCLKNYYRDINMSFFDVFNSVHNPEYYYGKENKKKKKENSKSMRKSHPVFKVSD